MRAHLLIIFLLLAFAACKSKQKNTYAIRDFRNGIQADLRKAVSSGIVYKSGEGVTFQNEARDEELLRILKSEHAKLRALAFEEILSRKTESYLPLLTAHLDDTALLIVDEGEWGYKYTTVADYMLRKIKWKTEAEKQKIIDDVILNHGYLQSAHEIMPYIPLTDRYYNVIKKTVLSDWERTYVNERPNEDDRPYKVTECALYALSTYQKTADTALINDLLTQNIFDFGKWSFKIISSHPSAFHFSLLEKYYKDYFYQNYRLEERIWSKVDFVRSITSYKSQRSAEILNEILSKNPIIPCPQYSTYPLEETVYDAIISNPCIAYEKLKNKIEIKDHARNQEYYPKGDTTYLRVKDLERW